MRGATAHSRAQALYLALLRLQHAHRPDREARLRRQVLHLQAPHPLGGARSTKPAHTPVTSSESAATHPLRLTAILTGCRLSGRHSPSWPRSTSSTSSRVSEATTAARRTCTSSTGCGRTAHSFPASSPDAVVVRLQGTEFALIKYALEQQGLRVRGDVPSVHNQRVEARTRVVLAPS